MINLTPFTTYTGEENLCQEIPSHQSFCGGITTSKTSRTPLQEISRSVHSSWQLHETVLEVNPNVCLEFNPIFQTRFVKKSQIISKFDPENPGASTHSMARKAQSQKQPNQFILETATPTAPRSTTSFRPISTGDQMINIQPKFNVPAANYNNTQKFHCFEDKVGELVIPVLKDRRDPNLDYISPKTLVEELMNNPKFELHILDCRYDYEFRGGHIKNAINVTGLQFLQENLFSAEMLGKAKNDSRQMETENILVEEGSPEKETIIVLYCEFTQKRAPQVQRALRNIDRKLSNWPDLYYPHVYLLEGGYSKFYEQYPEVCDPNGYVEMLDLSYKKEYRAAKERENRAWNPRANFDLEDPETFTLRSSKRREDF